MSTWDNPDEQADLDAEAALEHKAQEIWTTLRPGSRRYLLRIAKLLAPGSLHSRSPLPGVAIDRRMFPILYRHGCVSVAEIFSNRCQITPTGLAVAEYGEEQS